jgi:diphosphoinositol-polyphosphate diphosphatase
LGGRYWIFGAPEMDKPARVNQKYEDGARLLACCIPVRYSSNVGSECPQFLLVSSRSQNGLLFPKGGWENDESLENAATREAFEEAGIKGKLELPHFGVYEFSSKKCDNDGHGQKRIVYVFLLEVSQVLEKWPESGHRQRFWVSCI